MARRIDGWKDRWVERWMDRQMDGRTDGRWVTAAYGMGLGAAPKGGKILKVAFVLTTSYHHLRKAN